MWFSELLLQYNRIFTRGLRFKIERIEYCGRATTLQRDNLVHDVIATRIDIAEWLEKKPFQILVML